MGLGSGHRGVVVEEANPPTILRTYCQSGVEYLTPVDSVGKCTKYGAPLAGATAAPMEENP